MLKWVIGGILALCGIGGAAYGVDQHKKRKREQAAYRKELKRLEAKLRDIEDRFGRQSAQFKAIAAELARLRRSVA